MERHLCPWRDGEEEEGRGHTLFSHSQLLAYSTQPIPGSISPGPLPWLHRTQCREYDCFSVRRFLTAQREERPMPSFPLVFLSLFHFG